MATHSLLRRLLACIHRQDGGATNGYCCRLHQLERRLSAKYARSIRRTQPNQRLLLAFRHNSTCNDTSIKSTGPKLQGNCTIGNSLRQSPCYSRAPILGRSRRDIRARNPRGRSLDGNLRLLRLIMYLQATYPLVCTQFPLECATDANGATSGLLRYGAFRLRTIVTTCSCSQDD